MSNLSDIHSTPQVPLTAPYFRGVSIHSEPALCAAAGLLQRKDGLLSVGVGVFCAAAAPVVLQVGLHKLEGVVAGDYVDAADAVAVRHTIDFVRLPDDLHSTPTTDLLSSQPPRAQAAQTSCTTHDDCVDRDGAWLPAHLSSSSKLSWVQMWHRRHFQMPRAGYLQQWSSDLAATNGTRDLHEPFALIPRNLRSQMSMVWMQNRARGRNVETSDLGVEGGDDELGWVVTVVRLPAEHASHSGPVLGVQGRIDLIKQIEGRRVAAVRDQTDSDERMNIHSIHEVTCEVHRTCLSATSQSRTLRERVSLQRLLAMPEFNTVVRIQFWDFWKFTAGWRI